ncbi:MAG: PKD domain-containing protein, partial [Bdellovibrio sp.]|nr:PKD domain-containing protein [Bdellovibrio sp.]
LSYDPDGFIAGYELKIGADGEFLAYADFSNIAVPSAGDYEITLRVTDNLGVQSVSAPITVHVAENQAPTVSLSCSVPDQLNYPLRVVCNTSAVDSDGTISQQQIDWGDGNLENIWGSAMHVYTSGGTKSIIFTAKDNFNAISTITEEISLTTPPTVAFSCFHINSLTIKCDASASTDDGSIVSYAWSLGGILKTGTVVTQEFLNEQSIVISLTVTDDKGMQRSQDQYFYVQADPDIKLPFASFKHTIGPNMGVQFDASESLFNNRSVTKFKWDFGNGETLETNNPNINYTYQSFGWYTVSLTTFNENSIESEPKIVDIRVYTPVVSHPGSMGESRIEGIDSDSDGLRDDLQLWVDEYYGENQNKRNAFRQITSTIQQSILEHQNPLEAKPLLIQEYLDQRCVDAIFALTSQGNSYFEIQRLKVAVFNTYERLHAYSELSEINETIDLSVIPQTVDNNFINECKFEVTP